MEKLSKKDIVTASMATSEQGNVQLSRVNYIAGIVFDKTDEESIEITTIGAKNEFLTGFGNR